MATAESVQQRLVPDCKGTASSAKMDSLGQSRESHFVDSAPRTSKIVWRAQIASTKRNVSSVGITVGTTIAISEGCQWMMTNVGFDNPCENNTITQLKMCRRLEAVLVEARRSRQEPRDLGDPGAPTNTQTSNKRCGLIRNNRTSLNNHRYEFRIYVMFRGIAEVRLKRYGEALHTLFFWIS